MKKNCEHCQYYYEPDIGMTQKECNFPWLGDWTEEEAALMKCQEEFEEAAE